MITKVCEDTDWWLGYSLEDGHYFLHTEIYSWSLSKYKKYLAGLSETLKELPTDKVYSLVTEKSKKFNELFGFTELGKYDVYTLMELDNVWKK